MPIVILILVLLVALVLIALAVYYWYVVAGIAAVYFGVRLYLQHQESKRDWEEARARGRQKTLDFIRSSVDTFEAMPQQIQEAEGWLDRAEGEFNERAFAPFWDSVENAIHWLENFDASVTMIAEFRRQCAQLASAFPLPPEFPITVTAVQAMAAANTTNERMTRIVGRAQRDFYFATIFEQRRTNQILTSGFATLAQAIEGMGDRITSSIDDLGSLVSEHAIQMKSGMENLASGSEQLHVTLKEEAARLSERQERTIELLDSIHRERRIAY